MARVGRSWEYRVDLSHDTPPGCPVGCLVVGAGIELLLISGAVVAFGAGGALGVAIPATVVAVLLGTLLTWGFLRRQQAAMLDADVLVRPEWAAFGQKVRVTLWLQAKGECPLGRGHLGLRCQERAIARGGTSDTTYTHTAFEDQQPLEVGRTLYPGETIEHTAVFVIPEGLPASFEGRNNFIEWQAVAYLAIPGPRLDLRRCVPLRVLPEVFE